MNAKNAVNHRQQFRRVFDGHKRRIRGLWQATATGVYYAQIGLDDPETGERRTRRVPLPAKPETVAQAVEALARLKVQRRDGEVAVVGRTPRFSDYVTTYLEWLKAGDGQKAPSTMQKEEYSLNAWKKHLGGRQLNKIYAAHINSFVKERLEEGVSMRTAELDKMALRNILNHAIDEKYLKALPFPRVRRNKSRRGRQPESKRELLDPADLEALCKAALAKQKGEPVTKNGQQFADYIRFLAYSGARRNEALGVRWGDVDLDGGFLTIARQVTSRCTEEAPTEPTKNNQPRKVDFNPNLEALLHEMHKRRAPDCDWLFPSPQRGKKDIPAKTFKESFELARKHVLKDHPKLKGKAFHDFRHFFISYAVMSGADFMTIASWVGHQDGGVLIGKVYGHLSDSHKKQMAQKLNFGPAIVELNAVASH